MYSKKTHGRLLRSEKFNRGYYSRFLKRFTLPSNRLSWLDMQAFLKTITEDNSFVFNKPN